MKIVKKVHRHVFVMDFYINFSPVPGFNPVEFTLIIQMFMLLDFTMDMFGTPISAYSNSDVNCNALK